MPARSPWRCRSGPSPWPVEAVGRDLGVVDREHRCDDGGHERGVGPVEAAHARSCGCRPRRASHERAGAAISTSPRDPLAEQRIDDDVAPARRARPGPAHQRGSAAARGRAAEAVAVAHLGGEQLAAVLDDHRAQAARWPSVSRCQWPRTTSAARPAGGAASRADPRGRRAGALPRARRPTSRARGAARRRAGCRPDRRWRRRGRLRAQPGRGEARLDERGELVGGDLSSRITGPAL